MEDSDVNSYNSQLDNQFPLQQQVHNDLQNQSSQLSNENYDLGKVKRDKQEGKSIFKKQGRKKLQYGDIIKNQNRNGVKKKKNQLKLPKIDFSSQQGKGNASQTRVESCKDLKQSIENYLKFPYVSNLRSSHNVKFQNLESKKDIQTIQKTELSELYPTHLNYSLSPIQHISKSKANENQGEKYHKTESNNKLSPTQHEELDDLYRLNKKINQSNKIKLPTLRIPKINSGKIKVQKLKELIKSYNSYR